MNAFVNIAGKQMNVKTTDVIYVPKLDSEVGSLVSFDQVLLVEANEKITVGTPIVAGAKVVAKVMNHMKGDKVIVFKKKRRKGYKVKNGHRQQHTKICIEQIITT